MSSSKELSIIAVLLASLIGSAHCAVMCGGFVALIQDKDHPIKSTIQYHLGRLITYAALGAVAGQIGKGLNDISGLNHIAAILVAAWFVAQAVLVYFPAAPVQIGTSKLSYLLKKAVQRAANKSFLFGLTSGLLPCGWLYSNVLLAASTGTPTYAAIYMATFWLGTVPALQSIVFCSALLRRFLPTRSRLFLSSCYLIFALFSTYLHLVQLEEKERVHCHLSHERDLSK